MEDQFSLQEAVLPMTTATTLCMSSQSMRPEVIIASDIIQLDQLVYVSLLVEIKVIQDH